MLYASRMETIAFDWLVFISIIVMVAGFVGTYLRQRKENNLLREQNMLISENNSLLREQNEGLRNLPMPQVHVYHSCDEEPEGAKVLYQDLNEDGDDAKNAEYERMYEDAIKYAQSFFLQDEDKQNQQEQ